MHPDIDPARHHIGRDQQPQPPIAQVAKHSVAFTLGQVAVDGFDVAFESLAEPGVELILSAFGAAEGDRLLRTLLIE